MAYTTPERTGVKTHSGEGPELWQLETLLQLADEMDMKWVETLLGYYGKETRLDFWTKTRARTVELLNMIEDSEDEEYDGG